MKLILKSANKTGQSLIEIVVAVGIIMVVLVGVSDLVSRSLSLASFQKGKNEAINIAQNQLTYYRQQRDLKPTDFFANLSSYTTCVENTDPKYDCSIVYNSNSIPNGTKMTVNVAWKDADKEIITTLSQVLAKPTK